MRDIAIVTKLAIEITKNDDFDKQMNRALEIVGEYLQVSRAYIFINEDDGKSFSNRYEWCNEGIDSEFENNIKIPYSSLSSVLKLFEEKGRIKAEDISELPKDLAMTLKARGIISVAAYPIEVDNKLYGFVSFDECFDNRKWYKSEVKILESLSILLSNEFEKKDILEKLQRYKDDFQLFFDTIEDFIIITDMSGKIVEVNKYIIDTLKYTNKEIKSKNIIELNDGLEDIESRKLLKQALNGDRELFNLEFSTKNGNKIFVEARTWIGKWNNQTCLFVLSKNTTKEQEALQKFSKLFDSNPSIMSVSTVPEARIIDVNQAFLDIMGYQKNEVIGKTAEEVGMIIENVDIEKKTEEFNEEGKIKNENIRIITRDKKIIDGLISGEIIESNGEYYYLTVMIDISKQIKLQNMYNMERTRLESLIDSARLGTWEWNIETGNINYNDEFINMLGYNRDEIRNLDMNEWMEFMHPEDLVVSRSLIKENFNRKLPYYEFDCRLKHKNGNYIWVNNRGKIIEWNDSGKPLKMYGTYSDITEKKVIENKLKEVSIKDSLTNIYNRRYIYERMNKDIVRAKREDSIFSVVILDIDRFKKINDTYGHIAGDYILRKFTEDISADLRPYDLLGRYGGEEFIIILYGTDKNDAYKIIMRILEKIRNKTYKYEENKIKFTFSAGIADIYEFDESNSTNEKIIGLADERLYKAKRTGRNKISFF